MNNMQTIVNNEIKNQREYMDIQRKRIVELKKMKSDIEKGKKVDTSGVILSLQKSGIIDKNGKIKKRYRVGD
ncbi:MAG: hypothetical protein MSH15_05135 [Oscillospiraceae bacterium]|nr:hypothetical protein [Oscillospiraceae bacterium]